MELTPIKTRIMHPPQDDLFTMLDETEFELQERDFLVVTGKVVSIHQGRCVEPGDLEYKRELARREAQYYLDPQPDSAFPRLLTITNDVLITTAGIDASNAKEHFILLPQNVSEAAREIWEYVRKRFDLKECGVIITDTHSQPLHVGAIGTALAWFGFHPLDHHKGKPDLFGREMRVSRNNIPDAIAAAAVHVMGECDECTPLVRVRDGKQTQFCDVDTRDELVTSVEQDVYYPLLKGFTKNDGQ